MASTSRMVALKKYLEQFPGFEGLPVFTPKLSASQTKIMPVDCVVIQAAGGEGFSMQGGMRHQRVDVLAYGATALKADELHEKVTVALEALSDKIVNDILLCNANLEVDGTSDEVPATVGNGPNWPYVISTWEIESLFEGVN